MLLPFFPLLEGPLSGNYLSGVSSGSCGGCEFTTVIDFTLDDFVCRNNLYISNAGGYLNDTRDDNRVGNIQLHSLLNSKKKHLRKRNRRENTVRREGGT